MKKYNYKKIRDSIRQIVKQANDSKRNKFDITIWRHHILPVVEHSLKLGKKLKADLEVLELAALLHDYASMVNSKKYYKNHHQHGAILAAKILEQFNLPQEKIEQIEECILAHRGSVKLRRRTLVAKIIASADAMSHITELADMFFLAFGVHGYKTPAGARWLKGKLRRSWRKIMPQGKKIIQRDYAIAKEILNRAIAREK